MRMRPDVKQAAEQAAKDEVRSLNSFVEALLIEKLQKLRRL